MSLALIRMLEEIACQQLKLANELEDRAAALRVDAQKLKIKAAKLWVGEDGR